MAEYAEQRSGCGIFLRVFRHFRVFRVLPVILKKSHPMTIEASAHIPFSQVQASPVLFNRAGNSEFGIEIQKSKPALRLLPPQNRSNPVICVAGQTGVAIAYFPRVQASKILACGS